MTTGKKFIRLAVLGGLLLLGACSSSSPDTNHGALLSASQDLTGDPTGRTTVLTFSQSVPVTVTPGQFEADGGQLATAVTVDASTVTVVWDERVTPNHTVRAVGIANFTSEQVAVTTTNATAPTFAVANGTQTTGLGGDSFDVQFSGAMVVESTVEDTANWDLTINGTSLDLSGSTISFDPGTQSATVTLGSLANLHANFTLGAPGVLSVADVVVGGAVAGTATGDSTPPNLVSAVQNLTESEFGFVVDFTFDEAMDPAVILLSAFDPGVPVFATQIEQPAATPAGSVLRVTFTGPIIPGKDTVDLDGVLDAHGNALPTANTAIAVGTTVANAFAAGGPTVSSVENIGGDTVVAQFVQPIDPETAALAASWDLESPVGVDIDLSTSTFDYDFLAKTLTITIDGYDFDNADDFRFGPSASPSLDVDGQAFGATVTGAITGDTAAPTIVSVTQNRAFDASGLTYDVLLSEDVQTAPAELTANYAFDSGANISSATLQAGGNVVRLVVDAATTPGEHLIDVANLVDIAGNTMVAVTNHALVSSDGTAPSPASQVVSAIAGLDNDTVAVTFDDDMIEPEVTDPNNWIFESPTGTILDTSTSSVAYDSPSRTATLTFDGGDDVNLKGGDSYTVSFVTMRDLGGNVVSAASGVGEVDGETETPTVVSAFVETADATKLHVRFSEPVEFLADALTSYVVRDDNGFDVGGGTPTIVEHADAMGVTLGWAVGLVAGFHTVDVKGVADLAGNEMFPALLVPIEAEVGTAPVLAASGQFYVAVSGEGNDTLDVVFDQKVSPWGLLDPTNYSLTNGTQIAAFEAAELAFDGDSTVTVSFPVATGIAFDNGSFTLTVDNVLSAQGLAMAGASVETATADVTTDVTAAISVSGQSRLDANAPTTTLLIEMDEALDGAEAATASNLSIGAVNPSSVSAVGPRTIKAVWAGGVTAGQTVDISIADLAGNVGLVSEVVQAADTSGPAVTSVAGVATSGVGRDLIRVAFSEPVTSATALDPTNYTVSAGGVPIDVSTSPITYASSGNVATIHLDEAVDLQVSDTINVMVSGVTNHAGLAVNPPANINGVISGDTTPPAFIEAFANYRESSGGLVVDVRFSEDLDLDFAFNTLNYVLSGGQGVTDARFVHRDMVRLSLTAPLSSGDTIDVTGALDMAGNASGAISIEPTL